MLLIRLIRLHNRFVPWCLFSLRRPAQIFSVIESVLHTLLKCLFHGQVEAPKLVVNKVRQQVGALSTACLVLVLVLVILFSILLVLLAILFLLVLLVLLVLPVLLVLL